MKKLYLMIMIPLFAVQIACAQDIIIFDEDDVLGAGFYDASFGATTGSYLRLAGNNDKLPIITDHVYQGQHSGLIRWKQNEGGQWRLYIASDGWARQNAAGYDSLIFYLNGPRAVSSEVLPHLSVEDIENQLSSTTPLANHFAGLDGDVNTWQLVQVPLSAFEPRMDFDFDKMKAVRFSHGATTADTITFWIDEIRIVKVGGDTEPPAAPQNLAATPYDRLVELNWDDNVDPDLLGYNIYRAPSVAGPFNRVNNEPVHPSYYVDATVQNNTAYFYRVTAVDSSSNESSVSNLVNARPTPRPAEDLLEMEQRAAFFFFWFGSDATSGVSLDRSSNPKLGATGATGFGLTTYPIAAERGWITRPQAADRVLKVLRFYRDKAPSFHGFFSHTLNPETGAVIPFAGARDDGADVVESAYFFAGALTCRQYFDGAGAIETEIRQIATDLYYAADWQWLRRTDSGDTVQTISWHWSPNYGFQINFRLTGFNEAMIVYLLALSSSTHQVPASVYHQGWASTYRRNRSYYGISLPVESLSASLFTYQYSHCWVDYRNKSDAYADYFENSRNATLINRQYCITNPGGFVGYSDSLWGLTACDGPGFPPFRSYDARGPFQSDDGTIAPTAALASMPFTPDQSMAVLHYMYNHYREGLWGPYGFRDAFNLTADPDWFDPDYLGIDQGPIVIMIENHRSQLVWNLFMSNAEVRAGLEKAGFITTDVADNEGRTPERFELEQNYPNPFNAGTVFRYHLPQAGAVQIAIYDLSGRLVDILVDEKKTAGEHVVHWNGINGESEMSASGVYFVRMRQDQRVAIRKVILLR